MSLCTFEVSTVFGRRSRLGAVVPEGFADLHSACAWHLALKGEARPERLAGAIVPPDMLEFLRGGETSLTFARATLEHLATIAGKGPAPRGADGEQLIFKPAEVRLLAHLPRPASFRDFYAFE